MHRPYQQKLTAELRIIFEEHRHERSTLRALESELAERRKPAAVSLLQEVKLALSQIDPGSAPPNAVRGVPDGAQPLAGRAPDHAAVDDDQLHPDDWKRPSAFSQMRPPGTAGLPEARTRRLQSDLTLNVPSDADLPPLFEEAINALIAEVRRDGSGLKRYELEDGQRQEAQDDIFLYAFPFIDEAELFEDAQIQLQVAGRLVDGSIVSIVSGKLVLGLREELGAQISKAVLFVDTTALLEALVKKIEQVQSGEISLNRSLADNVAGRDAEPSAPELVLGQPGPMSNSGQRAAFEEACQAAVTWIWGPPGCGKTHTLAEIVEAYFSAGKRVLICSNTNKAVDQVLYKISDKIGLGSEAIERGLVVRLGRIADNKLAQISDLVTLDGIAERLSQDLSARKAQIESDLAALEQKIAADRTLTARFAEFDRAKAEADEFRTTHSHLSRSSQDAQRERSSLDARISKFRSELSARNAATIRLFHRSEDAIQRDLARMLPEHEKCTARLADLQQQLQSASAMRNTAEEKERQLAEPLAGVDRSAHEARLRQSADQTTELIRELREIGAALSSIKNEIVKNARVIGATCAKAYLSVRELGAFDAVIVDEASMVLLPVAWFVSGMARERVVICGDFRQIPPIVQSEQQAIVDTIGRDAFTASEALPGDPRLKMLGTQYRMDDRICRLIAEPMYRGELRTAVARRSEARDVPKPFDQPLTIVDTSDIWPFETQNAFFSRFNLMHALLARNVAHHLKEHAALPDHESFGVCTPYSAQAKIIGKLVDGLDLRDTVQVGTVHSYQGDERKTMLLDIPESHGGAPYLGQFVQGVPPEHVGARLINVAVSRAKERLILIANLTYLDKKLPSTSLLRSILYEMQQNGAVVSGSDVLALRPIERDLAGLTELPNFEELSDNFGLFDEQAFEQALMLDIAVAKRSVTIFSGYVTPTRVGKFGDLFRRKVSEGVKIRCVTRPPQTNGSIPEDQGRDALDMLEGVGVVVDCRAKIHQKVCLIDGSIVWLGSINALSHAGRSDETMTRAVDRGYAEAVAAHMSKRRVSADKAAGAVAEAENPRCERCGSRTTFKDGRYGPYFDCENACGWRANEKSLSTGTQQRFWDSTTEDLPVNGPSCPDCGGKTQLRSGRRGPFYGCKNYPTCKGVVDATTD